MNIEPIGFFHSESIYKFDAPRQGLFGGAPGVLALLPHMNFEAALDDVEGFERLWLVFGFHLNSNWKPKTSPPIAPEDRRFGVFATRSPYRPNPLGLSCVRLLKRDGLSLHLAETDLLDGTPVFDIKPYIPEIDSFPDSKAGWRDELSATSFTVVFSETSLEKSRFIAERSEVGIVNFCRVQLSYDPLSSCRKRVEHISPSLWSIGCRTWRITYSCNEASRTVSVLDVFSNYSLRELAADSADPYGDKTLHRLFNAAFGDAS